MRFLIFLALILVFATPAMAQTKRIVVLGDSLTAGYNLPAGEDFVTKLQEALIADEYDVKIDNAGVSGDTTAGGKSRLEWAVEGDPKPYLVLVALGANDMLRGLDPALTKKNIGDILSTLKKKNMSALLIGMKSPLNLGPLHRGKYDNLYPDLAKEFNVPLHPFFLEGVALNAENNIGDGLHPNEKGIAVMVEKIMPIVKKQLD